MFSRHDRMISFIICFGSSPPIVNFLSLLRRLSRRVGVSLRVLRLPRPHVLAHVEQGELGLPAELLLGEVAPGVRGGHVAGAAVGQLVRDLAAARLLERLHHLQD